MPPRTRSVTRHALLCPSLLLVFVQSVGTTPYHEITNYDGSQRSINTPGFQQIHQDLSEFRPTKCEYGGERYEWGAEVATSEPCLRCRCARGALVCYLRVCPPLPDPPPPRCLLLLKKGHCCSELKCGEGAVPYQPSSAVARFEEEDGELTFPAPFGNGCVHRGTLYASGSAMSSSSPCEHCFCIAGSQRCVRPSCLPPPPGCTPLPARLPACCPARYDCKRPSLAPLITQLPHSHTGCQVDGRWYPEGDRVAWLDASVCDNCFCLRGLVRCMAMSCAPALLGCRPIIKTGECCPHSYDCGTSFLDSSQEPSNYLAVTANLLTSMNNEDRSFHYRLLDKPESTTAVARESISSTVKSYDKHTTPESKKLKGTTRKSQEMLSTKLFTENNQTYTKHITMTSPTISDVPTTTANYITDSLDIKITTMIPSTTKQPDGSIRIVINGTINCTSEFSTSSLPINETSNMSAEDYTEARTPNIDRLDNMEDYTFNPNYLITDRTVDISKDKENGTEDLKIPQEDDIFMVNVSTYVRTNLSHVTLPPVAKIPAEIEALLNISTKIKDDYDYSDATLPPSLPNLKIIPFVAADAVLENGKPGKTESTFPLLERNDKFPVYFPSIDHDITNYSMTNEDNHNLTEYPIYSSAEINHSSNSLQQNLDLSSDIFSAFNNEVNQATHQAPVLSDYTVVTSRSKFDFTEYPRADITSFQNKKHNFDISTQSINLFSPPIETEGGFLPKDPPVMNEYYGLPSSGFSSSPDVPVVSGIPQTTSINFDRHKECETADGRRVPPGGTVRMYEGPCARCVCTWGVLLCSEPACPPPPPGCHRAPQRSDLCCGVICVDVNNMANEASSKLDGEETTETVTTTTAYLNPIRNVIRTVLASANTTAILPIQIAIDMELNNHNQNNATMPTTEANNRIANETNIEETATKFSIGNSSLKSAHVSSTTNQYTEHFTTEDPSANITQHYDEDPSANITQHYEDPSANITQHYDEEEEPEEEEEEDEGFSFGSVLKLLLSDSYDSTTSAPYRRRTTSNLYKYTTTTTPSVHLKRTGTMTSPRYENVSTDIPTTIQTPSTTTTIQPSPPSTNIVHYTHTFPSILPFMPLAVRPPIEKDKKKEHLILGQVSSIEQKTDLPMYPIRINPIPNTSSYSIRTPASYPIRNTSYYPIQTNLPYPIPTTSSPIETTSSHSIRTTSYQIGTTPSYAIRTTVTKRIVTGSPPTVDTGGASRLEENLDITHNPPSGHREKVQPSLVPSSFGGGMLKLAGCNIYGMMYRVGRIITELSNPCLQCMCTELGVQCRPLLC